MRRASVRVDISLRRHYSASESSSRRPSCLRTGIVGVPGAVAAATAAVMATEAAADVAATVAATAEVAAATVAVVTAAKR